MSNPLPAPTPTEDSQRPRCLVCASDRSRLIYKLSQFQIRRCDCDQVYLFPLPSEAVIEQMFAQLYEDGRGSVPELRDYYASCFDASPASPVAGLCRSWLEAIARHGSGGRLLDIGCGTGVFCHSARGFGWDPLGVDEAKEAVAFARERYGLEVHEGSFETKELEAESFDLVTMWDVIEHSRAPRTLIEAAARCLKRGGLLALSTPNQRNIMDLVAGMMYRLSLGRVKGPLEKFYLLEHFLYFSPHTLSRLLTEAGFEMLETRQELTDLRRLTLNPLVRFGLEALFAISKPLKLENRVFAIARKL